MLSLQLLSLAHCWIMLTSSCSSCSPLACTMRSSAKAPMRYEPIFSLSCSSKLPKKMMKSRGEMSPPCGQPFRTWKQFLPSVEKLLLCKKMCTILIVLDVVPSCDNVLITISCNDYSLKECKFVPSPKIFGYLESYKLLKRVFLFFIILLDRILNPQCL